MTILPISLTEKLSTFDDLYAPRVVGSFNGHDLMVAKLRGEFVWHSYDDTDDFFLVLRGTLTIEFRDRAPAILKTGDLLVIPQGVEHRPVAHDEAHVLLIERAGTPNTGDPAAAASHREI